MKREKGSMAGEHSFWLQNKLKLLSFHPEASYEKMVFMNHKSMWKKVHELVEQGYRVH